MSGGTKHKVGGRWLGTKQVATLRRLSEQPKMHFDDLRAKSGIPAAQLSEFLTSFGIKTDKKNFVSMPAKLRKELA